MRASIRGPVPPILVTSALLWTARWIARRKKSPSARFQWPKHEKKSVRDHLLPHLCEMTANHCAYCDWFPANVGTLPEIDHFVAATRDPALAFDWHNLYLACTQCNRAKGDQPVDGILRPDDPNHDFERWFLYERGTGMLRPNPAAPRADRERAQRTIDLFALNHEGRPEARERELEHLREHGAANHPLDRPFAYLQVLLLDEP